ncbi:hypothetical protein LOTGIDRAFT_234303 [Lottia gigantea]|uniref:Uncharacterized protein n=1 Tax=Lottia gigantea TaxID=225164 RepID=V4A3F3_LOTGI|nr:hypothetical protein LOTGIDRAFT_234303 [Lottia gigantea]ESO89460.1 hypothetical protein LOTGIDRAFT_234303 [Lottia gigantea]
MSQGGQGYPMHNYAQQQGPPVVSQTIITTRPSDYFGCALFTCLCCFWPTGIAALVFSCNSRSAADRMDFAQAENDGRMAKIFSIISLVIGLVWMIAVIIYVVVVFVVLVDTVNKATNDYYA